MIDKITTVSKTKLESRIGRLSDGDVIAAFLTPSTDPWNQMIFAAPMIGLYLISIGIAWLVAPKRDDRSNGASPDLRLVVGAMVAEQAWRRRRPA